MVQGPPNQITGIYFPPYPLYIVCDGGARKRISAIKNFHLEMSIGNWHCLQNYHILLYRNGNTCVLFV